MVWQDRNFQPTGEAYCNQVRNQYDLSNFTILYDPTGGTALANWDMDERHVHYVMRRGLEITHRRQFNDSTWAPALQEALDE